LKRHRTIVYWEFNIDILGPRYEALAERQKARRALAKRLKQIERAALLAAQKNLPPGFRAILS
jgi:hypothetical protein